ncbi:tRNA-splicing endonuclease subunit Sen34-like [Mya arenaria]|uniref:tRNA-splicing endonuclease subunit Sen34-like n=1 Tax=Mya arenaria TaxID=6604 RepID=UPI0022E14F37|nr:tRNA-splicing endonuclease subunit Sen34-like [Mya arenaria]
MFYETNKMSTAKFAVKITKFQNDFLIWSASDSRVVREEFRIVGTLTGCLPRAPHQNTHLGLPLQLCKEEVRLLIDKGFAELVETVYEDANDTTRNEFKQREQESYERQIDLFKEDRKVELKRCLPKIIEGKKAKRNKLLDERKKKGEDIPDSEYEAEIELRVEDIAIPDIEKRHMMVQTPLECATKKTTYKPVDWDFPHTDSEKLRYAVFRDLWERGHFITSGLKFGGDFLSYPGDPSRFHSFFIVVCRPYREPLCAGDIVTMGRLGTSVKKTVVLCSLDDAGRICYTSLQWTGIS